MSQPWICPKCERGVAPGLSYCDHGASTSNVGGSPSPAPQPPAPHGTPWTSVRVHPDRKEWPFDPIPRFAPDCSATEDEPKYLDANCNDKAPVFVFGHTVLH